MKYTEFYSGRRYRRATPAELAAAYEELERQRKIEERRQAWKVVIMGVTALVLICIVLWNA